jgi:hypothetical protein
MIKLGQAPYLECSSKGDKRFSAFYARVKFYGNKSIEELYQAAKLFEDGRSGLTWREAKGKKALNQKWCNLYYAHLWDYYIWENPYLLEVLKQASGLSDLFGQEEHCCQAVELWRIRNKI